MRLKIFSRNWASVFLSLMFTGFLVMLNACENSEVPPEPPQLAEVVNWSEVYLKQTCSAQEVTAACPGQNGFHVDAEGQVSIGPEFGPVEPGVLITLEELSALVRAANAVAQQSSESLIWQCEAWVPAPGENGILVRLHDENGVSKSIYQKSLSTLQVCYRGDKGLAEALFASVNPLVNRYGILPTPTPTQSPTPTSTPTSTPTTRSLKSW